MVIYFAKTGPRIYTIGYMSTTIATTAVETPFKCGGDKLFIEAMQAAAHA